MGNILFFDKSHLKGRSFSVTLVPHTLTQLMVVFDEKGIYWMGFEESIKQLPLAFKAFSLEENIFHDYHDLIQSPLPLCATGTPFQQKVWQELLKIPHGETTTYKAIANAIIHPKAQRAVGSAVGANPLCPLIPCHRVLPEGSKSMKSRPYLVGNYRYGHTLKRALLKSEGLAP